ncbi:MAG: formylglycine-generating enzyme family protein [Deltaproteobacteria bacterium]|nr:formylglycine-generating enzyme family protein [Deltaproteobacteria bacterium]
MRSSAILLCCLLAIFLGENISEAESPKDTKDMLRIPGGVFFMGCNRDLDLKCQGDERPGHRVMLKKFWMDRHEVTGADYKRCVAAGACSRPAEKENCNHQRSDADQHPVNCVSWHQADRYCRWAKKRLPTEAEWEKAARSDDGRSYPWGQKAPSCEQAVMVSTDGGCGSGRTSPVCSKPSGNSPYGLCDMAGNVWEWTADWYQADLYLGQDQRNNPKGPAQGKRRVLRGGSLYGIAKYLRTANRDADPPRKRDDAVGFRCAADAPPGGRTPGGRM